MYETGDKKIIVLLTYNYWIFRRIYLGLQCFVTLSTLAITIRQLRPDFAHKIFGDSRTEYCLLMVTLAEDASF